MEIPHVLIKIVNEFSSSRSDGYSKTLNSLMGDIRDRAIFLEEEESEIVSLGERMVSTHHLDSDQVVKVQKICIGVLLKLLLPEKAQKAPDIDRLCEYVSKAILNRRGELPLTEEMVREIILALSYISPDRFSQVIELSPIICQVLGSDSVVEACAIAKLVEPGRIEEFKREIAHWSGSLCSPIDKGVIFTFIAKCPKIFVKSLNASMLELFSRSEGARAIFPAALDDMMVFFPPSVYKDVFSKLLEVEDFADIELEDYREKFALFLQRELKNPAMLKIVHEFLLFKLQSLMGPDLERVSLQVDCYANVLALERAGQIGKKIEVMVDFYGLKAWFPQELWRPVFQILIEAGEEINSPDFNPVAHVLKEAPQFIEPTHRFLSQQLKIRSDVESAKAILQNREMLYLGRSSPLFKEAAELASVSFIKESFPENVHEYVFLVLMQDIENVIDQDKNMMEAALEIDSELGKYARAFLLENFQKAEDSNDKYKIAENLFRNRKALGIDKQSPLAKEMLQVLMPWKIEECYPKELHTAIYEDMFENGIYQDPYERIDTILRHNPTLMEPMYAFFSTQLNSPDIDLVKRVAMHLFKNSQKFLLHMEHPLFQEVITAIHTTLAEDIKTNKKNKFVVHKKVLDMRRHLSQQTKPPFFVENIRGEEITWDPKHFISRRQPITISQLPEGVDFSSLKKLFQDLEDRINALPEELQKAEWEKIEKYIKESSDDETISYERLKLNLLNDPYIQNLFIISGGPESAVPIRSAQFLKIVEMLQEASNELEEVQIGEGAETVFLSSREDMLLKISQSIQACSVGKEEGIGLAYQQVPEEKKYHISENPLSDQESPEVAFAKDALDRIMQEKLMDLCSSNNALMQELTQDQRVKQLSHQALYVKNVMSSTIGLEHPLTFDPHTGVLYDALIEKSPDDLQEIVLSYAPPSLFIEALMQKINGSDEKGLRKLFALIDRLEEIGIDISEGTEAAKDAAVDLDGMSWQEVDRLLKVAKELESDPKRRDLYNAFNSLLGEDIDHSTVWDSGGTMGQYLLLSEEGAKKIWKASGLFTAV